MMISLSISTVLVAGAALTAKPEKTRARIAASMNFVVSVLDISVEPPGFGSSPNLPQATANARTPRSRWMRSDSTFSRWTSTSTSKQRWRPRSPSRYVDVTRIASTGGRYAQPAPFRGRDVQGGGDRRHRRRPRRRARADRRPGVGRDPARDRARHRHWAGVAKLPGHGAPHRRRRPLQRRGAPRARGRERDRRGKGAPRGDPQAQ